MAGGFGSRGHARPNKTHHRQDGVQNRVFGVMLSIQSDRWEEMRSAGPRQDGQYNENDAENDG
jgi:hypothetical protein